MTLGECYGGDIVVVEIEGEQKFVYVGNVLWQGRSRKKMLGDRNTKKVEREPTNALVSFVDPQDLRVHTLSWFSLDADTEVVEVVESGLRRRELEKFTRNSRMWRITGRMPDSQDGQKEVDPLSMAKKNGGW